MARTETLFEQFNELAKQYARFDDGLDDDFVEEEWQFVREEKDEDDDEENDVRPSAPDWYLDDEDEDLDDEDYEDAEDEEDDDQDWDAGTEDYEDDEDEDDDWYENEED